MAELACTLLRCALPTKGAVWGQQGVGSRELCGASPDQHSSALQLLPALCLLAIAPKMATPQWRAIKLRCCIGWIVGTTLRCHGVVDFGCIVGTLVVGNPQWSHGACCRDSLH